MNMDGSTVDVELAQDDPDFLLAMKSTAIVLSHEGLQQLALVPQ